MTSILYVWMPTEKIYPEGPIYLADYVHKKKHDRRENIGKHVLLELEEKLKRP